MLWTRGLLLLLMLSMVFGTVACKDDGGKTQGDVGTESETVEEEITYPFEIEDLGDENGAPTPFNMITRTDRSDFIYAEQDGTIMHDAVFERNALAEELFNVEITMFEGGDSTAQAYIANVQQDVLGGESKYDCVLGWPGAGLEVRGWFMNLLTFPEFDFENDEWWLDSWTKNAAFNDCLITCNGDLQFEIYYSMFALLYNKPLAASIEMNPYPYVDNKTWTLEQLSIYCEQIAREDSVNGGFLANFSADDDLAASDCIYGITSYCGGNSMVELGAKFSVLHEDGSVEWQYNSAKNIDIYEKYFDFWWENDWAFCHSTTPLGFAAAQLFTQDRALFHYSCFRMVPEIRATGVSYGLLPFPMLDEEQGEYISYSYSLNYFAFLTNTRDFHASALVLNALNALSTEILYDRYFGELLAFRYADDPESSRMVPIIKDALYLDFLNINSGVLKGYADYTSSFQSGKKNVASSLSGVHRMLDSLLNATKRMFDQMREINVR